MFAMQRKLPDSSLQGKRPGTLQHAMLDTLS